MHELEERYNNLLSQLPKITEKFKEYQILTNNLSLILKPKDVLYRQVGLLLRLDKTIEIKISELLSLRKHMLESSNSDLFKFAVSNIEDQVIKLTELKYQVSLEYNKVNK